MLTVATGDQASVGSFLPVTLTACHSDRSRSWSARFGGKGSLAADDPLHIAGRIILPDDHAATKVPTSFVLEDGILAEREVKTEAGFDE